MSLGAMAGAFALAAFGAGPVAAAPVTASASAGVEIPITGGLFAEVQAAPSVAEKRALLERGGFVESSPGLYTNTVDGFTAEYRVTAPPPRTGVAQPDWKVTWEGAAPGLFATVDQWKAAANGAAPIATFACGAITVWWGAGACGAAVQYAISYINSQNLPGNFCVGYVGYPGTGFLVPRAPGNC
jgi:hypothetical protein